MINHWGVNLVRQLNWMNVKQRCIYFSSILMYKCLNSLAPDYLCDEFILQSSFNDHSSRSVNNVFIPHGNHKSFSVHCAILWNNLPNSCKAATSLYSFKKCQQVHVFKIWMCVFYLLYLKLHVLFHLVFSICLFLQCMAQIENQSLYWICYPCKIFSGKTNCELFGSLILLIIEHAKRDTEMSMQNVLSCFSSEKKYITRQN